MCLIALLSFAFLSATVFGQGTGASLGGTITDASQAVLPGATVVARNVDTGVTNTTTSNNSGIYNFPSLPVGSYAVFAEAAGFQRAERNIRLNIGAQGSLNISLAVAGTVTEVQVTGAIESVLLEAGSSTGTIMQQEMINEVPLIGNNIMDLINIMGGVVPGADPVYTAGNATFAGVASIGVNVSLDGLSVVEVRNPTGIAGNANINPEVIGEFKMILSAVDAEMGRGAGQVRMTTRSGSNAFHGSGVWNNINSALDAREWEMKRRGTRPNWHNVNNYNLSVGGPIIKNKTFFFTSWEQQLVVEKANMNAKAFTPCAAKGIYRWISGWVPTAIFDTPNTSTTSRTRPSVDVNGKPLLGAQQVVDSITGLPVNVGNGSLFPGDTGELRFESVLGQLTPANRALLADPNNPGGAYGDCSSLVFDYTPTGNHGVIAGTYWGAGVYRNAYDPTNYVGRFMNGLDYSGGRMEIPGPINNYEIGDGLNFAGTRWPFSQRGLGSSYGTGGDPERKSLSVKIDHNINNEHRLSGTYSFERFFASSASQQWPRKNGGYSPTNNRRPMNLILSLTSTLRPTLLNEARFGWSKSGTNTLSAQDNPSSKDDVYDMWNKLMPTDASSIFGGTFFQDRTVVIGAGEGMALFSPDPYNPGTSGGNTLLSYPLGSTGGLLAGFGGSDHRWSAADTVTWMKGAHSFKGGAEVRLQDSFQAYAGARATTGLTALIKEPFVYGGVNDQTRLRRAGTLARACTAGSGWCDVAASSADLATGNGATGNYTTAYGLMSYFAGSIHRLSQYYYMSPNDPSRWNDPYTMGEDWYNYKILNRELSFFFKDDWKVTKDLTLNLGVRYEYYGVPYVDGGRTLALLGGSIKAFGISQGGWDNWMNNRQYVRASLENRPAPVSEYAFVGPGSPNPNQGAWNKDLNNFAPHVGFAWQLPWLRKSATTLRGGYAIAYTPVDNFNNYGVQMADVSAAGVSYRLLYYGEGSQTVDSDQNNLNTNYYMDLTDLPRILPMEVPASVRPMTVMQVGQFTGGATANDDDLSNPIIHSLNMSLTHNLSKSMTLDVRYIGTLSRKQVVSTALNSTDYISNGLYLALNDVRLGNENTLINSLIPPGTLGGSVSGSQQLRSSATTNANLARGNFLGIANTLATGNGNIRPPDSVTQGMLSRAGCLPEDRNAGGVCTVPTPWNYFYTNPQFSTTAYRYNGALSNYHSMQAQLTMRPTRGLNFQTTWTWSRMLGNSAWTDFTGDRFNDRNYYIHAQHRSHTLNTYGSYTLPFGHNGYLFRGASGAFKKAIEGWQVSWILSLSSGAPASVTGSQSSLWSDSQPNLVRPDLWDNKAGKVAWNNETNQGGFYFGRRYTNIVLDANICNPDVMTRALYTTGCLTASGTMVSGAPRVLALADSNAADGVARYGSLDEALKYDPLARMELKSYTIDSVTQNITNPVYNNPAIVIFRNADQRLGAGAQGNFKPNQIAGQGTITFDTAMSKSVEFMEGKRFEVRIDAQNILNHPTASNSVTQYSSNQRGLAPSNPSLGLSAANFGYFTTKLGRRTFQARLRLSF